MHRLLIVALVVSSVHAASAGETRTTALRRAFKQTLAQGFPGQKFSGPVQVAISSQVFRSGIYPAAVRQGNYAQTFRVQFDHKTGKQIVSTTSSLQLSADLDRGWLNAL